MGGFVSLPNEQSEPLPSSPSTSSNSISLMSLYHPFPLRIDTFCEQNRQYDACLQIGEFTSDLVTGSKIVILVPLKVALFAGESGVFINAVANKLPNILNQQPDKVNGYPDVPAQPGADWSLDKVIKSKRGFYTWNTKDGTQVIVMASPINILISDMANIKRLPLTPPEDVIHEIGQVYYRASVPINCFTGEETGCEPELMDILNSTQECANPDALRQDQIKSKKDSETFFKVLFSILGIALLILTVWLGIRFAMGPGKTLMNNIGESLGKSLAGGYDALKKVNLPTVPAMPKSIKTTRRNLGSRLGLGATGNFGTKRQTPTDKSIDDMFPVLEPSEDIKMNTNPLFKSKDDFAKFQERNRTRKNPKQGTIGAIANLPAVNIPEPSAAPAPVPSVEKIIDDMPAGVTVNPVVARRRSARNTRRSSVNSIKSIPQLTNVKPAENTPAAISNLPTPEVNPALAEIEDLQKSDSRLKQAKSNALKKVSVANQLHNVLNPVSPPPIPKQRNKTLRNSALKVIAAKQAEKKLGQVQAKREIDNWMSEEPSSAAVPAPVPAKEPLIPKSEFETWDRSRQSAYVQKLKKDYAQRVVNGYVSRMKTTIGTKPWNPSTKVDSPSRLGKGGRKRRNRRKTGNQLRNRKKTGRKI
jgi:hypothetical protein